jgi:hypothetical protein
MKSLKPTLLIAVSTIIIFLSACTYTNTYMPQLTDRQIAVADSIKHKYGFENISIEGKKIEGSGTVKTLLTISLINGKDLPTDSVKQTVMLKEIGAEIKGVLKNPKEFETYDVLLVTRVVNGAETNSKFTGHEFSQQDL